LLTSSGKPIGFEEFLARMVETLGITIDGHPKKDPIKWKAKS